MTKSKRDGTRFESQVVDWLQANGFPYAERLALQGRLDRGDITGIPGCVLELKRHHRMDLAGWVDEAEVEFGNARSTASVFAVVHKRWGVGDIGRSYVTQPLWNWADLIR